MRRPPARPVHCPYVEHNEAVIDSSIGFETNEMYWLSEGGVWYQNLYNKELRSVMADSINYEFTRIKRDYLYGASDSRLDIYRYLRTE